MTRHVQGRVKCDGHAAVKAHGWIKYTVEIAERDPALRLVVDEETEGVRGVQVQEDTHRRTLLHAAFGPLRVSATVHEPGTLSVYVHAPTLVVLACGINEIVRNTCHGVVTVPKRSRNSTNGNRSDRSLVIRDWGIYRES